jgi:squalene-hopene/tetraprenyl-beta-curcumene cyclase
MISLRARLLITLFMVTLTAFSAECARTSADEPAVQSKRWTQTVDQGIRYLRGAQGDDGGWSSAVSPGVTGVVLTGLLETGRVGPDDPTAARALKFIEALVNEKDGHIAGRDPRLPLQNYVTSVNVMALMAADRHGAYKKVVGDAVAFLKKLQWDESEGKGPDSDYYGGAGYDSTSRPDLSNTQMFLDALQAAGVPKDDPALKKALVFVSRCQNLKGEHNDQPWAEKINDGSFIYSAAAGGQTKSITLPSGGLVGYGSMTYAGMKSMIYCGVSKDDPRIKKAYEWVQKNYDLNMNPGMPKERGDWGLYYYYHTMAKTLSTMGVDEVIDAKGVKHNWRLELLDALSRRQKADGSWVNVNHWLEADPNLVTGYALMALSYCKPTPSSIREK